MKKFKLLFTTAALLLAGATSVSAQTDVTSTYLTNADFEGEYTVYSNPSSDRAIYQPTGWTITYSNGEANDLTSFNSSCTQWNQFSGKPQPANGGNNTYWIRFRWGNSELLQLTQSVTLPAGQYSVSADAYFNGASNAQATLFAGENTKAVTTTSWTNYTLDFVLTEEKTINIGFKLKQNSQQESIVAFDNFTLTYTAVVVKDVLNTALTAAIAVNNVLSDASLGAAITTAQAVYNNEDATQDEVNAAAATLNAATELAMSAAGDVTGIFLSNSGFESCTAEASNVAAKSIKDYSSVGWTNATTGSFTTIAVTAYGGGVKVGDSTTPSTKKDGTTVSGKTLGIIAGWGDNVTIQSGEVALPAGVYTFTVDHYLTSSTSNYDSSSSKFGFVSSSNSYLVSSTTFAASTWTTETVTFTLTESTIGKIQIGLTGLDKSGSGSPAVFYDDITITYKSFLAGAKEAYDEAVAAAEAAKTACPNVTGEELAALNAELAKAEPTTVAGYEEATADLKAATATLTAAKGVYDAYAEIRAIAIALSVAPGDAPANAAAAPAATHALNVAVYTATTAENIFNVTEIYNPSWSSMGTSSGQHWSGDGSISYADEWRGDTNPSTRNTTVTLPAGSYILMSAGRGSTNTVTTMSANGTTVTFASNGDMGLGINKAGAASFDSNDATGFANKSGEAENTGTGWEWRFIPVTLAEETAVTVTQTLTRLSGSAWGSFSDFRILKIGVVATAEDYTALNSAISTADAKTLGFENGKYAPYNNVAALEALAQAKAIDQDATNDQDIVQAVTTALSSATWNQNDVDLDAIYNGMFDSDVEGDWGLTAWTRTNGWGQQQKGLSGDYATAYYNQPGSLQYGNQGVYTMPLAGNTIYKLTFAYRSHEDNSNTKMTVSVLNAEDGLAATEFAGNGSKTEWKLVSQRFRTGAAGNYVLTLANGGNTWMTNVSLVKEDEAANITIAETATSKPQADPLANVTLTRTLSAEYWNTFSVPFDAAIPEGWTVKEFDSAVDNVINFKDATTIEAGVPYLVKPATKVENPTFNGVIVEATEGETMGEGEYKFAAQIYNKSLATDGTIAYLATDNSVKRLTEGGINGLRAYFIVPESGQEARIAFIGDDTTGINAIKNTTANDAIYDLQGRKVTAVKKGIYVVNGKKIVK